MEFSKRLIPSCLAFTTALLFSLSALIPAAGVASIKQNPTDFALTRLKKEGLPADFISVVLKAYDESRRDEVIALNVLGFVAKADYSGHLSKRAVRECLKFMKKNPQALRKAHARYSVSPEVITALLWVETKHGRLLGSHKVAGVYFSLMQADHPDMIQASMKALAEKTRVTPEYEAKLKERSATKAEWAKEQLLALAALHRKKLQDAAKLKGSFAGAFGIPQFIPSSYGQWARSYQSQRSADLFRMSDAIQSVGYYLKSHGWKPDDAQSHQAALFGYNRSQGYVDVILKLADCIQAENSGSARSLARNGKGGRAARKAQASCSG